MNTKKILILWLLCAPLFCGNLFSKTFTPDPKKTYRLFSKQDTTQYAYYSTGSYIYYKLGMSSDQNLMFMAGANDGEYYIYIVGANKYFGSRNGALNTSANKDKPYTMTFVETVDGIDYYNFKDVTGNRWIYFDFGSKAGVRGISSLATTDNYKLAIRETAVVLDTTLIQTAINNLQALADTIAIQDVKTKLLAEITAADTLKTKAETQIQLNDAVKYLNALRTFAVNIQSCKILYDTTIEGSEVLQYPAMARTDFLSAVNAAISAFATVSDLDSANSGNSALDTAKTTYKNAIVPPAAFVPLTNKMYKIIHSSSYALSKSSSLGTAAYIETVSDTLSQAFRFLLVPGTTDTYNISVMSDGMLLAKTDSYNTTWLESTTENSENNLAQFQILPKAGTASSYIIKILNNSKYLGTDNNENGTSVYSDKAGNDGKHYWTFTELAGDLGLSTTSLENAIVVANELYDNSVEGTEPGQYAGSKADLQAAITIASALLDRAKAPLSTVTQEQIDTAVTALNTAIELFENSFVTVSFTPEANAFYRIFTADQTRWENQYLYTLGTAAESGLRHAVLTNYNDSTFLFQFVKEGTSWRIRPASEINKTAAEQLYIYERKSGGSGMAARLKTTDDSSSRFVFTWVKRENGVDYFSVKSEQGYWLLFGANNNDLKSHNVYGIDPNGSVAAEGSFLFAVQKDDPKIVLQQTINQAKAKYSAAVVGAEMGQYPQVAKDSLQIAIVAAQAVYDDIEAGTSEISAANIALSHAIDWFVSQEICFSTLYLNQDFNVIHSSGLLLSKDTDVPQIRVLNSPNASQIFRFEAVTGLVDVVALKSSDAKYLAYSGSYNTVWIDSIDATTQLKISESEDGYLNIKFVGKKYLGTDAITDSASIFADKSGNDIKHKWGIQIPGQAIKITLKGLLATVNTLLTETTLGTQNFDFPETARTALENAKVTAQGVYDNVSAVQTEVDAQITALSSEINNYYHAQILPVFAPIATSEYIISNKQYIGYLNSNDAQAIIENTPPLSGWKFTQVRDSIWVIQSGSKALAKSLNMVDIDLASPDQQWYVHFDGPQENNVYVRDTTDVRNYFVFAGNAAFNNVLQYTSTGILNISSSHSHSDKSQWFAVVPIGEPITDGLAALILTAQETLDAAVVGTAYGNYPQAAKDSLQNAITIAKTAYENSGTMNQMEINVATNALRDALNWFNNQKVVWKSQSDIAYYIGNRDNANYLSVDTLNAGKTAAYKKGAVQINKQLWFFVPVENRAGFYYIVNNNNALLSTSTTSFNVEPFNAALSTQWEIIYNSTNSNIEYFIVKSATHSRNITLYKDGSTPLENSTGNDNKLKFEITNALFTEIVFAYNLLDKASIGNRFGQYPQTAAETFLSVITASETIAEDADTTNDTAQLEVLKVAEQTFSNSQNGYGFDLSVLKLAVETANLLIENTTVVGSSVGQCPQETIDSLITAIAQAQDATGVTTQANVDQKVTDLNVAIANFERDLKASTGLTTLLTECNEQYSKAVEGTGSGQYAVGSKQIFKEAIDSVQTIFDSEPVKQLELIAAYNYLNAARDNFNAARVPDLDVNDLLAIIADVEAFLTDKQASEYTELRSKLAAAKALAAAPTTQTEIDTMTEELSELFEAAQMSGIEELLAVGIKVFSIDGVLHISGLETHAQIEIINTLGQRILNVKATGNEFVQPLEKTLYIVVINSIKLKVMVK